MVQLGPAVEVKVRGKGATTRISVSIDDPRADAVAAYHFARIEGVLRLQGIEVRSRGDELRITEVRKSLPLGEWEVTARYAAAQELSDRAAIRPVPVPDVSLRRARPRKQTPPYEAIAQRYRNLVGAGVKNPAAVIAEEFGITGTTARNWLRRARQLSVLAKAPMPGVAGEVALSREPDPRLNRKRTPRDTERR